MAGTHRGETYQWNNRSGDLDNVAHQLEDNADASNLVRTLNNAIRSAATNIVTSIDYTQPLDYTTTGDEFFNGGSFNFFLFDPSQNAVVRNARGDLRNTRVTITPLGNAVPEPKTWAMMIAGFGAAGAALRRSRGRPAHA